MLTKHLLQLASSSLLKIGQETDKTTTRNRESVYLLLDMVCIKLHCLHLNCMQSLPRNLESLRSRNRFSLPPVPSIQLKTFYPNLCANKMRMQPLVNPLVLQRSFGIICTTLQWPIAHCQIAPSYIICDCNRILSKQYNNSIQILFLPSLYPGSADPVANNQNSVTKQIQIQANSNQGNCLHSAVMFYVMSSSANIQLDML